MELVEWIIDLVAKCCPQSLPNCALVSWVDAPINIPPVPHFSHPDNHHGRRASRLRRHCQESPPLGCACHVSRGSSQPSGITFIVYTISPVAIPCTPECPPSGLGEHLAMGRLSVSTVGLLHDYGIQVLRWSDCNGSFLPLQLHFGHFPRRAFVQECRGCPPYLSEPRSRELN